MDLDIQHETEVDRICLNIETFDAENSSFSVVIAAEDTQHSVVQEENGENQSSKEIGLMKGTSDLADLACSWSSDSFTEMTEALRVEKKVGGVL